MNYFWKNQKIILTLFLTFTLIPFSLFATVKKLPRFVSIKSNEANARTGPGTNYPITWTFIKRYEPVEVIKEFQEWRLINDIDGKAGWIHISVLSPRRSVVIIGKNIEYLYSNSNINSKIIAKVSPKLRCGLNKCIPNWCFINCRGYTGWIDRKLLWGIYDSE